MPAGIRPQPHPVEEAPEKPTIPLSQAKHKAQRGGTGARSNKKHKNLQADPFAYQVGASEYGGPGDPHTKGDTGSSQEHLTGKLAFAELQMGHALGDLPMHTKLQITYKGVTVVAEKLDIGLGGAPVKGHATRVDLWWELARTLKFKGKDLITIERLDGKAIPGLHDEVTSPHAFEEAHPNFEIGEFDTGINLNKPLSSIPGGSFLGELSLAKITKLLIALGLGAFALIWLSKQIGVSAPNP